jgi:protein TonB
MARSAPLAPAPTAPDEPGIELPTEAEAGAEPGDLASRLPGNARAISGPVLSVPALPGPVRAGAPPSAPVAPDFDVRAYADSIRRRIDAEKQYPARARRLGLQGVATVLVTVDSRGRLVRPPRLARTSGVAALDHEALRMVQAAAPFTPPAGAAPATTPLEVQVPVRFSLADAP